MPVTRESAQSRRSLANRKAEGGGHEEMDFSANLHEAKGVAVAVADPVVTGQCMTGSVVCVDAEIEVTRITSRWQCVQSLGEGDIDADNGDELSSAETQTQTHETITDTLPQAEQPSRGIVLDGESDSGISSPYLSVRISLSLSGKRVSLSVGVSTF
nr:unnamed protein product [Spirometra erinaceieuropaei]